MKTATALLGIAIALAAPAQGPHGAGIVYGRDHVFTITAPENWVLDNAAGKGDGLQAVFYREGETWQKAATVMYANASSKRLEGSRTRQELMTFDADHFRERSPKLRITPLPDLRTADGTIAVVSRFEGDSFKNYEAVAYIDEKSAVIMLVLTSRTREGFETAYPDFEKLVGSYRFLTSEVRIK